MPLKKGSSDKAVSQNIATLLQEYDRKGRIGRSRPASRRKAQKQSIAIALSKSGRSRRKPAAGKTSKTSKTSKTNKSTASRS